MKLTSTLTIALLGLLLGAAVVLARPETARAAEPLWVNALAYGSAGGGFYWEPAANSVWTSERGWHAYAPAGAQATPLWVNALTYGSKGGGFYLDPFTGQVWTAERDWHGYSPGGSNPPPPAAAAKTFGEGKKLVGSDIAPGLYRGNLSGGSCYWERLSGLSGGLRDIVANDNVSGPTVVAISASDVAFNSSRCGTWTSSLAPVTSSPTAPFKGDGIYIVGIDVAPGTWRSTGATGCYWARLRDFEGGIRSIIANENENGEGIVTIASGDLGFESSRCGTWTKIG